MKTFFKLFAILLLFSCTSWAEVGSLAIVSPGAGESNVITEEEDSNEQVEQFVQNGQLNIQRNFLDFIVKNGIKQISRIPRKKSSEFNFEDLRLDTQYSYTSFDDDVMQSKGQVEDYASTIGGYISEKTSFTLGISANRTRTRGNTKLLIRSLGVNMSLHHKLNENYGLGTYLSYHDIDYEGINGNSYSYATGILGTTYHSFEYFSLSSATTIAYSDYDLDHDSLFTSMWSIDRQWTDRLNTFAFASFADSLRSDNNGSDGTYWLYGVGIDYLLSERFDISVTYERVAALDDYTDSTIVINLGYRF